MMQPIPALTADPLLQTLLALSGGGLLGLLFYGGLWWTIRRASASTRPGLWFGLSLPLRLAVASGGIFLVAAGSWPHLLLCSGSFVAMRPLVQCWLLRMPAGSSPSTLGRRAL